ncbi:MAG: prolipoprotein diacylglyceryl transferase [Oscillospiraceae bacterium]|nr:prolipoprotein diacylglyceryl transferase [Oscillospiraceae bacterium]
MRPYLIEYGVIKIPGYGLMMAIAAAAAWGLLWLLLRDNPRVSRNDGSSIFLLAICGAFIGAPTLRPIMKIVEIAIKWEEYKGYTGEQLLHYTFGELVFYGGLIGGVTASVLFCRRFKIPLLPVSDVFAPSIALSLGIGRIGCFLGGCCHGMQLREGHPLAVVYPAAAVGAPSGIPLLATQPLETIFSVILASVLTILYLKVKKDGLCTSVYLLSYPAWRFSLEFFRGDKGRGSYGWFTTSQYISLALFALGIVCLVFTIRRKTTVNALESVQAEVIESGESETDVSEPE